MLTWKTVGNKDSLDGACITLKTVPSTCVLQRGGERQSGRSVIIRRLTRLVFNYKGTINRNKRNSFCPKDLAMEGTSPVSSSTHGQALLTIVAPWTLVGLIRDLLMTVQMCTTCSIFILFYSRFKLMQLAQIRFIPGVQPPCVILI